MDGDGNAVAPVAHVVIALLGVEVVMVENVEALGLHARYIVEGYMAGEHKSPFRGFSIEFTQHREYVPGDDTRHLDWKVLGRTDRYYLKQYEQETNFVAHILLDASESMGYGSGSRTKYDLACTATSLRPRFEPFWPG